MKKSDLHAAKKKETKQLLERYKDLSSRVARKDRKARKTRSGERESYIPTGRLNQLVR